MSEQQAGKLRDPYEKARELTTGLERRDPKASQEVKELRSQMAPKEYNALLRNIELNNKSDRQVNSYIPEIILFDKGKGLEYAGTNPSPEARKPEATKPTASSEATTKQPPKEREYTNSNADRERLAKDFAVKPPQTKVPY